jgi:EF hand
MKLVTTLVALTLVSGVALAASAGKMDTNGDGKISKSEMMACDKDGNKIISMDELKACGFTADQIKMYDKNLDGQISAAELNIPD